MQRLFGGVAVVAFVLTLLFASAAGAQGRDLDCADFPSREAAQRELQSDPNDPHNLDDDNDGQACETFAFGFSGQQAGADDNQYAGGQYADDDGDIIINIPGKPLPNTGGAPLPLVGGALLSLIGTSLAVKVLRRP